MKFMKWLEKKTKKLNMWDLGVLKWMVLFFALWLAKVWPAVLGLDAIVYFVIWIVFWLYLMYRMFRQ